MFYTIYKITNQINGKIYIGKHQTNNLDDDYFGSGKLIFRAMKKYGRENFVKDILFVFDNEQEMDVKETNLVTENFCRRDDTYNLMEGGQGGWNYINQNNLLRDILQGNKHRLGIKHSDESKIKCGIKNKGKKHSKEHVEKNRLSHLGRKHTPESIQKMRLSKKLRDSKTGQFIHVKK